MNNLETEKIAETSKNKKIIKSIMACIPVLLLSIVLMNGGITLPKEPLMKISFFIVYIFINILFFLMVYTKKTYKYRKIFFVTYALLFAVSFMTNLIEVRGSIFYNESTFINGETPFCHMVIPMIIIPAALTKTIIFPGSLLTGFASIASMIVIWLGATLAFGRGFCSWACFYGGLDEGCSSLCKKPRLKINRKWTYLPFAILISIVLLSAATLSPVYCDWLCPFKAVTEAEQITSTIVLIKTIVFCSLFLILVIVLPILTRKRTQCGLFCPFGAFQSLFNKINIFEIRIDKDKCLNCKKCVRECPTYSIDESSLSNGKALITCTKCGKCIDICPSSAVSYHIKGTKIGVKTNLSRYLFLYPAYIFALTIGGGAIVKGLYRILKLITTGSFF
ncbi:4Fe-4S ferredoxin [Clostridium carboxidivorans P7]|uniref:4Fe-4S ferredoxin iron-sulfur binding domain protein n=1 Tax=Clostridium carboxidivorans P7 TaxID=536227 RepID=C6PZ80_9CLOT|nr:4Fe-4S binding protein [Clostridium carboxidivorans]AKN30218.1 4Fe-4S ferredoxin [Clostridium carboxidivorans P7]EET85435.1 4Fe-4S ferredoxin iron-sulfur binding domain protein [Clostridium carboxidivorans P7]